MKEWISLSSKTKPECLISSLIFSLIMEVLSRAIGQKNREYSHWKGSSTSLPILIDDIILHNSTLQEYTKKLMYQTSKFRKIVGYKINIKATIFLYVGNKYYNTEI